MIRKTKTVAMAVVVLAVAGLVLAACGSSSKNATSSNASATVTNSGGSNSTGTGSSNGSTPGATGTTGAPNSGHFSALRECLAKNGITLPTPKSGQGGKPGQGGRPYGAGGFQLPKGVSKAQYEAAFKKCGGSAFPRSGGSFRSSPQFKQALVKFASCMRSNGVNVPEPNTSGKGPVFNTKGLDTSSSKFKTAESKCRSELGGAFNGGGNGPGGGAGGTPPGSPPANGG